MKNEVNRALVAKKKTIKVIGYGLWVMVALLVSSPVTAQEWQSTSAMQGTGSSYAPQVTAVGATGVSDMATTTESYSPAKAPGGPHRVAPKDGDEDYPLGDAVLPLMLLLGVYCSILVIRRNKHVKEVKS